MATFSGMGMMGTSRGGGAPTGYDPRYGGIPNLPAYTTDTQTTVGTDKQAQMLKNLPGYQQMLGADTGNIQSNLSGSLSPDVISMIQQQAAERGVSTGTPGAPITDAAYLRALGLTSLQLQQLGHSQLTEAMARTPMQETQTGTMTRDLGAERAVYAAAPNPRAAQEQAMLNAQQGMGYSGMGGGRGGGGYTLNPASPTSGLQRSGFNSAPTTSYPVAQSYGATGSGADYKGYHWDPNTGQYVGDPSYGVQGWASQPMTGGGSGLNYSGLGMSDEQTQALQDLYQMNQQEADYYGY